MSKMQKAIRREIGAREPFLLGTVISDMEMARADDSDSDSGTGAWSWCCDVDIGENRHLRNVIVHAVNGQRRYARRGMSVLLRRNQAGRYDIVAPGDTVTATMEITYYDLDGVETGSGTLGYTFDRKPLEFYKGPTPGVPGTSLWNSPLYHWNYVRIVDGDGNPVS